MTPAEQQSAYKAVNDGKAVIQILRNECAKRERVRKIIKAVDFTVAVIGAIAAFVPAVQKALGHYPTEIAIALPPVAIILTSIHHTLTRPSDPARYTDHASDLALHVAQLEAALEAHRPPFHSNDAAIMAAKLTVQASIRAAVDKWPELLKDFA